MLVSNQVSDSDICKLTLADCSSTPKQMSSVQLYIGDIWNITKNNNNNNNITTTNIKNNKNNNSTSLFMYLFGDVLYYIII